MQSDSTSREGPASAVGIGSNIDIPREPRSSIEVTKNTRGFGWVAKLYASDGESDEELLARIQKITAELQSAYGSGAD